MTLLDAITKAGQKHEAGITFIGTNENETFVSYQQMLSKALSILGYLQSVGVRAGDEVVIQLEENCHFLSVFWACLAGKIIAVPLSYTTSGNRGDKLKNIWAALQNPYLVTDIAQAKRLSINSSDGFLHESDRQLIMIEDLMENKTVGSVAVVAETDTAYLQFSSGSTGTPKGVILTHHNLVCNIKDIISSLGITRKDVLLSWMPLSHDMGMIGFHLAAVYMEIKSISLPTSLFIRRPLKWIDSANVHRATVLYSPNFGLYYFISHLKEDSYKWQLDCVRIIVNGAEPVSKKLCNNFISIMGKYGLHPKAIITAYGLAEASVAVTVMPLKTIIKSYTLNRKKLNVGNSVQLAAKKSKYAASFADVGKPVNQCKVRIANEKDKPVNENIVGHIQIKGPNVTAGYYRESQKTSELFTVDGWLKTGDLGFLRNGRLVVVGRSKSLIIINGHNHYPQDIEGIIVEAGIVPYGKVVACGLKTEDLHSEALLIFVLFKGAKQEFVEIDFAIRRTVSAVLNISVKQVVAVAKIPKTTSGKVQRFLLLEMFKNELLDGKNITHCTQDLPVTQSSFPAENDGISSAILGIARHLMADNLLTVDANLLDQGLGSIKAMQLSSIISEMFNVNVPVELIFQYPVIGEIISLVEKFRSEANTANEFRLGDQISNEASAAQQRIWFECQLHKNNYAYNIPVAFRITGPFRADILEKAVDYLVKNLTILRTSFEMCNDVLVRRISPDSIGRKLVTFTDIREIQSINVNAALLRESFINSDIGLDIPCQLRILVIQTGDNEFEFVLLIHHIITDGLSLNKLFVLLFDVYNKLVTGDILQTNFKANPDYGKFVKWQKDYVYSSRYQKDRLYWLAELKTFPQQPVNFNSYPSPGTPLESISTATFSYRFSHQCQQNLNTLKIKFGTTQFVIVMAIVQTIIHRYTQCKQFVSGIEVTGRIGPDMQDVLGYVVNTICLKAELSGETTFLQHVLAVKVKIAEVLMHQTYPFEMLLKDKNTAERSYGNELFDILVLYQNREINGLNACFAECTIEQQECNVKGGFSNLVLEFEEGDLLNLNLKYNTQAFDETIMARFAEHFEVLLQSAQNNTQAKLKDLNILTSKELEFFSAPPVNTKNLKRFVPVQLAFESKTAEQPYRIAVTSNGRDFTYDEINDRANKVACFLSERCLVRPGDCIAFLVERDQNIVVAAMGILKASCSFLALDPTLPEDNLNHMITDSGARYLLTDRTGKETFSQRFGNCPGFNLDEICARVYSSGNPLFHGDLHTPAYIIYTSGSTGKAKGVLIEHQTLSDYVFQFIDYFKVNDLDTVIQQASVGFDIFIEEIFPALCSSASIVIAGDGARDIDAMVNLMVEKDVTILSTTPIVLKELNKKVNQLPSSMLENPRILTPSRHGKVVPVGHFKLTPCGQRKLTPCKVR